MIHQPERVSVRLCDLCFERRVRGGSQGTPSRQQPLRISATLAFKRCDFYATYSRINPA